MNGARQGSSTSVVSCAQTDPQGCWAAANRASIPAPLAAAAPGLSSRVSIGEKCLQTGYICLLNRLDQWPPQKEGTAAFFSGSLSPPPTFSSSLNCLPSPLSSHHQLTSTPLWHHTPCPPPSQPRRCLRTKWQTCGGGTREMPGHLEAREAGQGRAGSSPSLPPLGLWHCMRLLTPPASRAMALLGGPLV